MAKITATLMPGRGESDVRCRRVALDRTLNEGLARLLPLGDREVAQKSGRLLHAKTVHVGASSPRNLVNYPTAPPASAPTRVFCGNFARVPPRLVVRGDDAEVIEFVHLLRFFEFIIWLSGVNRSGRAEAAATPRAKSALGRRRGSPQRAAGWRAAAWTQGFGALKYFLIDAVEAGSRCRRLMRSRL